MKKYSYREFAKVLNSNGFKLISTGKHHKFSDGNKVIIVPNNHSNGLAPPLTQRLLKEAGIK
jgi:predicted RNA binding protein YcfA (HicA-like mRNA interferase family)